MYSINLGIKKSLMSSYDSRTRRGPRWRKYPNRVLTQILAISLVEIFINQLRSNRRVDRTYMICSSVKSIFSWRGSAVVPVGLSLVVNELDAFEELEGLSVERDISLYLSMTIKVRSYLVLKVDSLEEILNPTSLALGARSRRFSYIYLLKY